MGLHYRLCKFLVDWFERVFPFFSILSILFHFPYFHCDFSIENGRCPSGFIEVGVISITMEMDVTNCDDTKRKHVQSEQSWSKSRTLWNTMNKSDEYDLNQPKAGPLIRVKIESLLVKCCGEWSNGVLRSNRTSSYTGRRPLLEATRRPLVTLKEHANIFGSFSTMM